MPDRSTAEIRSSIEENRAALALSLENLHTEVARITDWRSQLQRHRTEAIAAGALTGTLLLLGLRRRRRKRR